MANNYNPDVAAILETLRKLGPPQSHQNVQNYPAPSPTPSTVHRRPEPVIQPQSQLPPAPKVDPTTITTWPPALRHVLKTVAANEQILSSIREMINTQHKHEREWHASRAALLHQHSQRPANRARLSSILAAVNPALQASNNSADQEIVELKKEKEELENFDKKVYKAQTQMVASMSKEMERLGIPFFGVSRDLLIQSRKDLSGQMDGEHDAEKDKDKEQGLIDEQELVVLQKRMVQTLEDLAG